MAQSPHTPEKGLISCMLQGMSDAIKELDLAEVIERFDELLDAAERGRLSVFSAMAASLRSWVHIETSPCTIMADPARQ